MAAGRRKSSTKLSALLSGGEGPFRPRISVSNLGWTDQEDKKIVEEVNDKKGDDVRAAVKKAAAAEVNRQQQRQRTEPTYQEEKWRKSQLKKGLRVPRMKHFFKPQF